ncbi:hypothetical protein [Pelosinus propionicus]|uniref:DUF8042 domain-containing protein n=1 Tax=Pelosinus propionicus DSM 13327 TaxID=1123291 RepID=A0A1I4HT64_9FIRM|nr:hypothetical protein [Pelosinus propionicus]SFL45030.1 hypothetical protein SAMN04490355_10055 [Pelosinus propionicus DSM 13327]
MQAVNESKIQIDELGVLLEDMKEYLEKVEQGCQDLPSKFHMVDKSESLLALTQIMEGLGYYEKLLKSVGVLLAIDFTEILYENTSIASLFEQFCQFFTDIYQATENEDYSLLSDTVEYDLLPVINVSQGILAVVQERYAERVR